MKLTRVSSLAALAVFLTAAFATSATARSAEPVTMDNFRDLEVLHETMDLGDIDYPRLEAAVFLVTNEQRYKRGLSLLRFHPLLSDAARGHAQRMVAHDFYDHRDPTSRALATPQDRGRRAGIRNPAIAENIHNVAAIQYDGGWVYPRGGRGRFARSPGGALIPAHTYLSFADSVVTDWMNSPGHRANIMHREARQLGIGAQFYWEGDWPQLKVVQNFQLFRDLIASPSAGRQSPPSSNQRPEPEPEPEPELYDEPYDDSYDDSYYDDEPYERPYEEPAPRRRAPARDDDTGCPYRDSV